RELVVVPEQVWLVRRSPPLSAALFSRSLIVSRGVHEGTLLVRLEAELAGFQVVLVKFDRDPAAFLRLAHLAGGVAAGEGVEHQVAGLGEEADEENGDRGGE